MKKSRILVVDDELSVCNLLAKMLLSEGYEVKTAQNGKDAIDLVQKFSPHLILLDVIIPNMNGMEILKKVREIDKSVKVVMISGMSDLQMANDAMAEGAIDYFTKPLEMTELRSFIATELRDQISGDELGEFTTQS